MHHLLDAAGVPDNRHLAVIEYALNLLLRLAFAAGAALFVGALLYRPTAR